VSWLRLERRAKIIDASRNHRDADDTFQTFIESGADDDVGVLIDLFANAGRGFVDLEQHEVLAAGNGDYEATGAVCLPISDGTNSWIRPSKNN
jgi:hypothetical protein